MYKVELKRPVGPGVDNLCYTNTVTSEIKS